VVKRGIEEPLPTVEEALGSAACGAEAVAVAVAPALVTVRLVWVDGEGELPVG
jgi:hypothetical protein